MYLSQHGIPNILKKDQVYHQYFQHLTISFHFFMKWECWCKVLCLINCNHKKNVSIFFDGKTLIHPSDFLTFNVNFQDHCKVSLTRSSGNTFFMLNGRSVPTLHPWGFFGWRLLLYAFLPSSLNARSRYAV